MTQFFKYIFLTILFFFCNPKEYMYAQKIDSIASIKAVSTSKFKVPKGLDLLPFDFTNATFETLKNIDAQNIKKITLVYTKYRLNEKFNQIELNKKRLENLYIQYPNIASNKKIIWQLLEQTGCEDTSTCKDFIHGFAIEYLKPKETTATVPSNNTLENQVKVLPTIEKIKKHINDKDCYTFSYTAMTSPMHLIDKKYTFGMDEFIKKNISIKKMKSIKKITMLLEVNSQGKIVKLDAVDSLLNAEIQKLKEFKKGNWWKKNSVKMGSLLQVDFDINNIVFSNHKVIKYLPEDTTLYIVRNNGQTDAQVYKVNKFIKPECYFLSPLKDTTIIKIFDEHADWKNTLLIVDVSNSMSDFFDQVLAIVSLYIETNKVKHIVFFNDANNKLCKQYSFNFDGIYSTEVKEFSSVFKVFIQAIRENFVNCDIPENNFEATLRGIKDCPTCEEVIMIADNYATPRDIQLIEQINKPVKIILCGAVKGCNIDYLNIASTINAKVYTKKDSIENLHEIKIGEEFFFNNARFLKKKQNKFVVLN